MCVLSLTDTTFCVSCVQSQQLPLSLRCQTLLLSKQEVKYLESRTRLTTVRAITVEVENVIMVHT